MSYFEMKDSLKFLKTFKKQICLKNQATADSKSIQNQAEHDETMNNFVTKLKHIVLKVILSALTLIYADFPVDLDFSSLAYLYGMVHQGILVPMWFMKVYPECYNYVLRNLQRTWLYITFSRFQRTQISRAWRNSRVFWALNWRTKLYIFDLFFFVNCRNTQ